MSSASFSRTEIASRYPCVIIGGGLSGLCTAALLALNGIESLVLEKNPDLGGCIFDYQAQGFTASHTIDWMSGLHEGGLFRKLLEKLELWDSLEFKPLDVFKRVMLEDYDVRFPADLEQFIANLLRLFPGEEKGLLAYRDLVQSFASSTWIDHFRPFKDSYYIDLLRSFFTDPSLIAIMSANINETMPAYLMILFQHRCFKKHAYVPNSSSFTEFFQLLGNRLAKLGVCIKTSCEVKKIIVKDKIANAVELSDGSVVQADMVVSSTDLRHVYDDLMGPGAPVSDAFHLRLHSRLAAYSLVSIFVGVRDTFPHLGTGGEPIVWLPSSRMEDLFSPDPHLWHLKVNIRSRHMPFLAPAGASAVDIRALVNRDVFASWDKDPDYRNNPGYKARKSEIASILLENSKHILGDFGDKVEVQRVASPLTFQRYTRNSGGSGLGWELSPREYVNGFRISSSVGNLYHVGQWASFPGVEGVINYCFSLVPVLVRQLKKQNFAQPQNA